MTERVPRHSDNLEAQARRRQFDSFAVADAVGGFDDAFVDGCINRHAVARAKLGHAIDVIVMMMGQQDRAQLQSARSQRLFDNRGVAGIDHDSVAIVVV